MTIKLNTIKVSTLIPVLCLSAALAITSCGKKDETATTETTTTTTTTATTTPAASTPPAASVDTPLSAAEKTQLTPVKTALVMANSAVKTGDMAKAKTQFDKFSGLWKVVEPMVKAKAGASYPMIESGISMVTTAMSGASPDKAKAGEGLNMAIKALTAVIDKK